MLIATVGRVASFKSKSGGWVSYFSATSSKYFFAMRSLLMVSRGNAPTLRVSVFKSSSSSKSRTPPLMKTTSPSLTPATCVTSRVEIASASYAAAVFFDASGLAAALFSFATGWFGCGWHDINPRPAIVDRTSSRIGRMTLSPSSLVVESTSLLCQMDW